MKNLIWLILSLLPLIQLKAQEGKASFDIVWKKTLKDPGQSGILFHNGDLFFTSHDVTGKEVNGGGRLISNIVKGFCYDSDGNMKWEIKMETRAGGIVHETFLDGTSITPVADEKSVYFASPKREFF